MDVLFILLLDLVPFILILFHYIVSFRFKGLFNYHSGHFDSTVLCGRKLCIDYLFNLLWQATCSNINPSANHPIHVIRRFLRKPRKHSNLVNWIPISIILQIWVSGTYACKISLIIIFLFRMNIQIFILNVWIKIPHPLSIVILLETLIRHRHLENLL